MVLLPFANLSETAEAREQVMPEVRARLERAGYSVVDRGEVEQFLESKRIRYLDSFPAVTRSLIAERFHASYLASGAVLTLLDGSQPIVALELRIASVKGETLWWEVFGLSAQDTAGMLELGHIAKTEPLIGRAIDKLTDTLPRPGQPASIHSPRGAPLGSSPPAVFRASSLPARARVCVLPFLNRTGAKRASWIAADLLSRRLVQSGRFEVVEPADLRAALVAEDLHSLFSLGPEQLVKVGRRLGTPLFMQGSVYVFREASPNAANSNPEIEVQFTLVDAERSRVLWTSRHARTGDDYEGLFQRGAMSNAVSLLDQVLAEMLDAEASTPRLSMSQGGSVDAGLRTTVDPTSMDAGSTESGDAGATAPKDDRST